MFNIPLIKFRRERLLELIDIGLDPGCVRILLGRIHSFHVTQRSQIPEIEVIFRKLERILCVILLAECVQDLGSELVKPFDQYYPFTLHNAFVRGLRATHGR